MDKRVILTGASGFIGRNLLLKLIKNNFDVITISRNPIEFYSNKHKNIIYKNSYESLITQFDKIPIYSVIHLATYFLQNHNSSQVSQLINSNLLFGNHLLELTKELNINSFINTSTYAQSVNGISYDPQNLYTATKEAFEKIIKFYNLTIPTTKFITLELFDTYGYNDSRPKFINLLLKSIVNGEDFKMSEGNQEISYQFIDDVTDAYLSCLTNQIENVTPFGSKYSIFNGEVYKLKDLANIINESTGKRIKILEGFYPYRHREIMTIKANYEILPNWTPKTDLLQGVSKILNYEQ